MDSDPKAEALKCLHDLENALRLGNTFAVHQGVFIWSQRRDAILAGEETWAEQRFDPTRKPGFVIG